MRSGTELIVCPICAKIIYRHDATPISARGRASSRGLGSLHLLDEMAWALEQAHRERIRAAEEACASHFRKRHPARLWLWRRLKWNPIMNKRWLLWGQKTWAERFDYSQT